MQNKNRKIKSAKNEADNIVKKIKISKNDRRLTKLQVMFWLLCSLETAIEKADVSSNCLEALEKVFYK